MAQEPAPAVKIDRKKLLVQPRNKDGSLVQVSFFEDPVLWAREKQQAFYGKLSATLRQMKGSSPLAATWALMLLSFGYGVFHAAGPGHGKAVISAWLLATENELRRGILISFLSALIQALTAILLVGVLFLVVASVGSTARNVAGVLETASYGLIALLGAYLVWTAVTLLKPVRARPRRPFPPSRAPPRRASRSHFRLRRLRAEAEQCRRGGPCARARLRLRPRPSSRCTRPARRLVFRQGLLACLRGGHQALHGGPAGAGLRQWAGALLGRHPLDLRHGGGHLHHRLGDRRHRRLFQEARRAHDARAIAASRLVRHRAALRGAASPSPFSERSCSSARWAPPTP